MRSELDIEAIIDAYLRGELNADEQIAFEDLRSKNAMIDHKVVAHQLFLDTMAQYAHVLKLKEQMDQAHSELNLEVLVEKYQPHPSKIVQLWNKNKAILAIAASFVLLAIASIYSIQSNKQQAGSFEAMSRDMAQLRRSQNNLIRDINAKANETKPSTNNARFGGTGFAISGNGYIVTNYHVVRGADSVYVQNSKGDSFKVKSFYNDPINDIAILKINDKDFKNLQRLPYALKKGTASIGEPVYTLGFPKDDIVLGDGYVSSKTGINGDTLAYQVAIPVNPGNSGGPLLDNGGNIVGIINGKESKTDGATFAVKSKYIIEALNAIPKDSLNHKVAYGKRSNLQGLKRNKQVEKLQDYVFMIKVYNNK
jgi:S1-C subfamily serine protease